MLAPGLQVGMQNSVLGALLASVHFPAHPVAAVPCAISGAQHGLQLAQRNSWRTQLGVPYVF